MANNYTHTVGANTVKCSEEDFERLHAALLVAEDEEDDEYYVWHGMVVERHVDHIHMYSAESGSVDELPRAVLDLIGEILTKAGEDYWEFGVCWECSRKRPGEFGGSAVRITKKGNLIYRKETWPEESELLPELGA